MQTDKARRRRRRPDDDARWLRRRRSAPPPRPRRRGGARPPREGRVRRRARRATTRPSRPRARRTTRPSSTGCSSAAPPPPPRSGPADDELVELKRILLRSREPADGVPRRVHRGPHLRAAPRLRSKALFYNAPRAPPRRGARRRRDSSRTATTRSGNAAHGRQPLRGGRRGLPARARAADGRRGAVSSVVRARIWRDNLGYCLIALDRVPEGLALVHEALETLESEGARSYTVYPARRPLLRLPEERPLRGGPLLRRGGPRARAAVRGRPAGREEPPLPPRRGLPPRGRRRRRARATSTVSRTSTRSSGTSARTSRSSTSATSSTSGADREDAALARPPPRLRARRPRRPRVPRRSSRGRADAATAVLAKDGTLYEVFPTTYGEVIPGRERVRRRRFASSRSARRLPEASRRSSSSAGP